MIVVMKPGATEEDVRHVIGLVHDYGLKEHVIYGTDRTVVACLGDKRMVDKSAISCYLFVSPLISKLLIHERHNLVP